METFSYSDRAQHCLSTLYTDGPKNVAVKFVTFACVAIYNKRRTEITLHKAFSWEFIGVFQ